MLPPLSRSDVTPCSLVWILWAGLYGVTYQNTAFFLHCLIFYDTNYCLNIWHIFHTFVGRHVLYIFIPEILLILCDIKGWPNTTYLLTWSMEQGPSREANRFSAIKNFLSFCETRGFITTFTSTRYLFLSWASSIQSIPQLPLPEDPS
jgi:hypothetical protein